MASQLPTHNYSAGNLRNHFLIAMPGLTDSIFAQTVTFVCDHNAYGAMGIVLNQPLNIYLEEVFNQLSIDPSESARRKPVLAGGPVNIQQGFVLHRNEGTWDSSLKITDEVSLTASRDIVAAIGQNKGPAGAQFALGYAGWSAGQLEEELSANNWLTVPADNRIIFDTPIKDRWSAVTNHLGFDLNLISDQIGHA
ncbi:MAG: putative transcriptional regulator [Lentisphaeria bacterium]|jgi:putative transcriptional regulator